MTPSERLKALDAQAERAAIVDVARREAQIRSLPRASWWLNPDFYREQRAAEARMRLPGPKDGPIF